MDAVGTIQDACSYAPFGTLQTSTRNFYQERRCSARKCCESEGSNEEDQVVLKSEKSSDALYCVSVGVLKSESFSDIALSLRKRSSSMFLDLQVIPEVLKTCPAWASGIVKSEFQDCVGFVEQNGLQLVADIVAELGTRKAARYFTLRFCNI